MVCYIDNLHFRTGSFGIGDESGLPFECSMRIFELYILFKDRNMLHFINLMIAMLNLKKDYILTLNPRDSLYKYIANGQFITDCLLLSDLESYE